VDTQTGYEKRLFHENWDELLYMIVE